MTRWLRLGLACTLATILASLPSIALADEEAVHLRTGAILRGQIEECIPGDHVTVILADKEVRRIPWAEVDRIVSPHAGPLPALPAPTAQAPPRGGPLVRVHIDSSDRVRLSRQPAGTTSLVEECTAPCDIDLPLDDTYVLTGSGMNVRDIQLAGQPGGSVTLHVRTPSETGAVAGAVIVGVGAIPTFLGLLITGISAGVRTGNNGALPLIGVGALTIGVGLVVIAVAKQSGFSQSRQDSPPARSAREPTWRGFAETEPTLPRANLPILFERAF